MNDNDDTEIALDLLPDEVEAPQIGDPKPEVMMNADETEKYLDDKFAEWRELPSTPPGVLTFGSVSFSQAELDRWLEKWTRYRGMGENDSVWL